MADVQLIDGPVLIAAGDTWCKTSGLKKIRRPRRHKDPRTCGDDGGKWEIRR